MIDFLASSGICSSNCFGKNKFLDQLAKSNTIPVEIFGTPTTAGLEETNQCGSEWKDHGVCCNPDDLFLYFRHEERMIWNEYQKKRDSIGEIVQRLEKLLHGKSKPPIANYLIRRGFKRLQNEYSKCQEALLHIRGPALCSVCSGRSETFFNSKKDKLLIDKDTCKTAIAACQPAFDLHHVISQNMSQVIDEVIAVVDVKDLEDLSLMMLERNKSLMYTPPKHLISAFSAIKEANTTKNQDQALVSACSLLVDIVKKPYTLVRGASSKFHLDVVQNDYHLKKNFSEAFKLKRTFDTKKGKLTKLQGQVLRLLEEELFQNVALVEHNDQMDELQKSQRLRNFIANIT